MFKLITESIAAMVESANRLFGTIKSVFVMFGVFIASIGVSWVLLRLPSRMRKSMQISLVFDYAIPTFFFVMFGTYVIYTFVSEFMKDYDAEDKAITYYSTLLVVLVALCPIAVGIAYCVYVYLGIPMDSLSSIILGYATLNTVFVITNIIWTHHCISRAKSKKKKAQIDC